MLVEKLRWANSVPVWDAKGNMAVLKAPPDYDWDGLTRQLLQAADLSLPEDRLNFVGSVHGEATVTAKLSGIFGSAQVIRPSSILSEETFGTPGIAQTDPQTPYLRIPRHVDQRSEMMSISIPKWCRSAFRTEADQFYSCSSEQ